ncbi:fluoride efflux transporter CrcB [Bacillus sp. FJAT-27445]|uniref:fluoride efflux transporter CrcB n=1 Tax=Bacillus sp. FJAT-27445 TaxID=1679166 RepID=UPI000743F233|nr:fluoride efflux transporter CrcB [Bacillus sp. FJAT-27445]
MVKLTYLFVGLGGAIGSILRYYLSYLHAPESVMPYGTLLVNLSGSFLLGWFTARFGTFKKLHPHLSAAFSTGLLGSYTTFSTFCLELVKLLETGHYFYTLAYLVISFAGGIVLAWLGYRTAFVKRGGVE